MLRIYYVRNADATQQHLVRATSRSQALNHVASTTLQVELAEQDTLVALVSAGIEVERARPEQVVLETPGASA